MSAKRLQLRKELTLLRPSWLAALALALSPVLLCAATRGHGQGSAYIGMVFFYVGCALPAMELFGREFSSSTFSTLLAQPLTRRRLWWTKIAALALVSGSVLLVFIVATVQASAFGGWELERYWVPLALGVLLTVQGCALAFSVWTRLGAGVFWLSILAPVGVLGVVSLGLDWATQRMGVGSVEAGWGLALTLSVPLLMGLCGWGVAYRRALVMEDVGFLDQEVDFVWLRRHPVAATSAGTKRRSATWQLVVKELRLQQVNVGLVLLFAVLMGAVFGLQTVDENRNTWVAAAMTLLWTMVWVTVPVLVGAVAVADERRLGVQEWQLTLPVSRRRQWWVKVGVCFAVAFALGVILPSLMELVYWREKLLSDEPTGMRPWLEILAARLVCWACGTTVALYASSLSRHLLQALSTTALLGLLGAAWYSLALGHWGNVNPFIRELAGFITVVGLFPVLMSLSRRNYGAVRLDSRRVVTNVAAIAAVLCFSGVLTAGLWNRSWEVFLTEPPAGPALPVKQGVKAGIRGVGGRIVVLTPDGWLWRPQWGEPSRQFALLSKDAAWLDAAATAMASVAAVRDDGTLWHWGNWPSWTNRTRHVVASRYGVGSNAEGHAATLDSTNVLMRYGVASGGPTSVWEIVWDHPPGRGPWQVGTDSNWVAVAAGTTHVVALKKDGTVWGWGDDKYAQLGEENTESHELPVRLPGVTNGVAISAADVATFAVTADGAAWVWSRVYGLSKPAPANPRRLTIGPVARAGDWGGGLGCAVDAAGRVLALGGSRYSPILRGTPDSWLGDTPVRALAAWGGLNGLWAVGTDGGLWRWDVDIQSESVQERLLFREFGVRIGGRSDWLDVKGGSYWGGLTGLTADGSLWVWGTATEEEDHSGLSGLLPPSMRPRVLARLTPE